MTNPADDANFLALFILFVLVYLGIPFLLTCHEPRPECRRRA